MAGAGRCAGIPFCAGHKVKEGWAAPDGEKLVSNVQYVYRCCCVPLLRVCVRARACARVRCVRMARGPLPGGYEIFNTGSR